MLLKNALIYNSDFEPQKADILVKDEKIAKIDENLSGEDALDFSGCMIFPGFIDIHTHTDIELLVNPTGDSKLLQGVTTEVSGNCGSSPFPYLTKDAKDSSEHLKKKYGIDVYWENIDGFYNNLEKGKIGINYASFTGHGDLRAFVMGRNDVQPSPEQLKKMQDVLEETIKMGSFGLSTGLEYAPGSYAKTDELIELSKIVAKYDGIYNTHMRNEDDTVLEAIEEAFEISRKSGVRLEIAHLKACNPANWHKVATIIEMLDKAKHEGLSVNADRYPYIAYSTGLSTFLPLWSRQGETSEIIARLKDSSLVGNIKEYAQSRGTRIGGWNNVVISSVQKETNRQFEGKSVFEAATMSKVDPLDFVVSLLIDEKLSVGMVGFAMKEENLRKILSHPLVMIGSDGNALNNVGILGEGKPHPRNYGTFPRVLGKYVREEKLFGWETAVHRMTNMAAMKIGLKDRGLLKENYIADIVVFNPETVGDRATFVDPKQFAAGIDYVIVGGKVAAHMGKNTGALNGQVIRKS